MSQLHQSISTWHIDTTEHVSYVLRFTFREVEGVTNCFHLQVCHNCQPESSELRGKRIHSRRLGCLHCRREIFDRLYAMRLVKQCTPPWFALILVCKNDATHHSCDIVYKAFIVLYVNMAPCPNMLWPALGLEVASRVPQHQSPAHGRFGYWLDSVPATGANRDHNSELQWAHALYCSILELLCRLCIAAPDMSLNLFTTYKLAGAKDIEHGATGILVM